MRISFIVCVPLLAMFVAGCAVNNVHYKPDKIIAKLDTNIRKEAQLRTDSADEDDVDISIRKEKNKPLDRSSVTLVVKDTMESNNEKQKNASEIDINIPETNIVNPNSIAVVIGNSNYMHKDIPSVDYAYNDAEIIKKYLVSVFGFREGNIIYETDVSKAKFEAIFGMKGNYKGRLYNYLKRGKSDIFIYYTGHGAPDPGSKQGYFVPADADPQMISLTGYPLSQLYENVTKIAGDLEVPNIFIVIDACFSGASEKGLLLKNVSPLSIEVENPLIKIPNAVVMTSSSRAELSSWYPEMEHSMFTYFFLKAVKDAAGKPKIKLTAGELFDLTVDQTEGLPYYARRLHGRIQTPQLMGDIHRIILNNE